jgi:hypothetical protein
MRPLIFRQRAFVICSIVLCLCSDAWAVSTYCIGNSLTHNCRVASLDGTVGYNIGNGTNLQGAYNDTTAAYTAMGTDTSLGAWRYALKDAATRTNYDFVTVQPFRNTTPSETLAQAATCIQNWMALQPNATFVLHTGWAKQSEFESEYHGGMPDNYTIRSPQYMNALIAEIRNRTGRTMRSTRAIDALDLIYHDVQNHIGPFDKFGDLWADDLHLNSTSGAFLAHNLMRKALGQPLLSSTSTLISGVSTEEKVYLLGIVNHAPEPSTLVLLGTAALCVLARVWRRSRRGDVVVTV